MGKHEANPDLPILERLLAAGYPKDQLFHHDTDLYVFVTDLTRKVIDEWMKEQFSNIRIENAPSFLFTVFIDQVTGKPMYDLAFQWHETDAETLCRFCHMRPNFDKFGAFTRANNHIELAAGGYSGLYIGPNEKGETVMYACGEDYSDYYYPKFCPECGRKLR